jgi:hypothetical protein
VVGELSPAELDAVTSVVGPLDVRTVATVREAEEALAAEEACRSRSSTGDGSSRRRAARCSTSGPTPRSRWPKRSRWPSCSRAGLGEEIGAFLTIEPLEVERIGDQDPAEATARFIVANLGVVFLFAVLIMYSSMIINGVIEEKGSRVVELLIEAVPARQLMTGKVLGLGIVGLGQTLVIFGPPAIVLTSAPEVSSRRRRRVGVAGRAVVRARLRLLRRHRRGVRRARLPTGGGTGVLVPANVLMITGYFVGFVAINAPDATFARVFGWLPPTAPYVMLVRQTLGAVARRGVRLARPDAPGDRRGDHPRRAALPRRHPPPRRAGAPPRRLAGRPRLIPPAATTRRAGPSPPPVVHARRVARRASAACGHRTFTEPSSARPVRSHGR